jgi:hypothetical protein
MTGGGETLQGSNVDRNRSAGNGSVGSSEE